MIDGNFLRKTWIEEDDMLRLINLLGGEVRFRDLKHALYGTGKRSIRWITTHLQNLVDDGKLETKLLRDVDHRFKNDTWKLYVMPDHVKARFEK